jgi:hypothetical protein
MWPHFAIGYSDEMAVNWLSLSIFMPKDIRITSLERIQLQSFVI